MPELNTLPSLLGPLEFLSSGLLANCKGYWRCEEVSGTNIADDSGNSHPGTASRTNILNNAGKFGNGGVLAAASSDVISIGTHADFATSGAMTIGMWIKCTSLASGKTLISRRNYTGGHDYINYSVLSRTVSASVRLACIFTAAVDTYHEFCTSNTVTELKLDDGNWHFIVFSYTFGTAASAKWYVDGVNVAASWTTGTGNFTHTANAGESLGIGANWTGSWGEFFNGSVDDIFLINGTALSSDQVSQIYGAVSYWRMEGNSNDSKGLNNGTDTSITYNAGNGKFTQGAGFGGASKILINDAVSLKIAGKFSIGCWFKTSASPVEQSLMQSYSASGNLAGIYLRISSAFKAEIISAKNSGSTINTDFKISTSANVVNDGLWHLAVGTWDGTDLKLYIDALAAVSNSWANAPAYAATNYVRIGDQNTSGSEQNFFTGAIDDAFLFSRALTDSEIMQLFMESMPGSPLFFRTGLSIG